MVRVCIVWCSLVFVLRVFCVAFPGLCVMSVLCVVPWPDHYHSGVLSVVCVLCDIPWSMCCVCILSVVCVLCGVPWSVLRGYCMVFPDLVIITEGSCGLCVVCALNVVCILCSVLWPVCCACVCIECCMCIFVVISDQTIITVRSCGPCVHCVCSLVCVLCVYCVVFHGL